MRTSIAFFASTLATALACPDGHVLTSSAELCGDICPLQGGVKAQSCVYYPSQLDDFTCEPSSLGSCVEAPEAGCMLKCLSNTWARNGSYAIGLRGASGSFGRAEPVRIVQDYRADNITELVLKNYNDEKYPLALLDGAFTKSSLTSLWIENVKLSIQEHVFPPYVETLVLRKAGVRWIPKEVFGLQSLKALEISGQYLDTTDLSDDEKAFLTNVNCTFSR
ncbi:hypothetical protein SPRG_14822 [Saprolegnia parasitica CBS 223.65]|uniref:Uncharacterized protein n=1 Tax=Saprolegnia parasitica (strain CBS 223.65) TaxID=695850 RepID=A0A067BNU0_SAPPC|nr:hypothetical protein SPRG_14822 [Saprolegnia parasitica CBS 223.65]KDO19913.1 hypothetical protein SPRG_14822 [Saprolegnia parasitica CBS 223.65]|eukprot:XP_012209354.1 hypothetical protein SPRG_14822 [Saprolegnia parasitica CBS 223.65]